MIPEESHSPLQYFCSVWEPSCFSVLSKDDAVGVLILNQNYEDEGHDYLESRRGQKPPCSVDSFLDLFSVRSLNIQLRLHLTYSWMERARLVFTFIYVSTNFIVYLENLPFDKILV